MSVLAEICARKREHIKQKKSVTPVSNLISAIKDVEAPRGFIDALENHKLTSIIAEVKKASPSKGIIREDFNAVEIAKAYESAGAACLSVLTDEPYFQGHDDYFRAVKSAVSLPMLRKDFMLDEYQIYESRVLGADCILLIMATLDDAQAQLLHDLSLELGMDVLVEVHDDDELERAITFNPSMIGVNNRSLKTLEVSLETSMALAEMMPEDTLKISESGIYTSDDIRKLQSAGYHGFLVGESLMRQPNVAAALRTLLQNN